LLSNIRTATALAHPEQALFIIQDDRDDIASTLFFLLSRKTQGAQVYNVVDDQPILQSECYRWLARRLNRPLPPIEKSMQQRKRGHINKRVSNAKLRSLVWALRYCTFAYPIDQSTLPIY